MSYRFLPNEEGFEPASGSSSFAEGVSALTAAPTTTQQSDGWQADDLVRHDTMNGAMNLVQDWMQFQASGGFTNFLQNSEFFGNGYDGNVTISSPTTLTRDMHYNILTISSGGSINTAGFRLYAQDLDISDALAGAITFNGAAGSAGTDVSGAGVQPGGAGGVQVVGTFISVSGGTGGAGAPAAGPTSDPVAVPSVSQRTVFASFVKYQRSGGNGGGIFGAPDNGTGLGATGEPNYHTEIQVVPVVDFATASYRGKQIAGGVGGGGGGGGNGNGSLGLYGGGAGGGGGAAGGFLFIGARNVLMSSTQPAGTIQAKGGAGGAGGNGNSSGNGGSGGGGGSGGSGGTVVIISDSVFLTDTEEFSLGVADVIDVSGGAGGQGGDSQTGLPGNGGDGGNGGVVVIVQMGRKSDDSRKFVYAPSTVFGADGGEAPYASGIGGPGWHELGGAGGVWKVAL